MTKLRLKNLHLITSQPSHHDTFCAHVQGDSLGGDIILVKDGEFQIKRQSLMAIGAAIMGFSTGKRGASKTLLLEAFDASKTDSTKTLFIRLVLPVDGQCSFERRAKMGSLKLSSPYFPGFPVRGEDCIGNMPGCSSLSLKDFRPLPDLFLMIVISTYPSTEQRERDIYIYIERERQRIGCFLGTFLRTHLTPFSGFFSTVSALCNWRQRL